MENKPIENYSDISAYIENILARLSKVEAELAELKAEKQAGITDEELPEVPVPVAMSAADFSEAIDLSMEAYVIEDTVGNSVGESPVLEDLPIDETVPSDEDEVEDLPAPDVDLPVTKELPSAETAGGFTGLFGEELSEDTERKTRRGRKPSVIINDSSISKKVTVMDIMADKKAWLHDIPGPEVKSLRSAIALGDQVLFIRRLFRDDSALYQDSIDKLNSMPTLEKAIDYLNSTFPEWDIDGEDVYRFMMAVRRKIRR